MRTFAGTLLLENIFDFVPTTEAEILNLSLAIFNPDILIVEDNCKTTLGKFETINYEAEGLTELATEEKLSFNRITTLLSAGTYTAATRHTSTCISVGGICRKCYVATYPNATAPNILDRVIVQPEYLANSEVVEVSPGVTSYPYFTAEESYNKYYVFMDGVLLIENADYSIFNNTFTLIKTIETTKNVVIRFIKTDRTPFLAWLASTYSGSLLGMKPMPIQLLPIRPLFLASTLLENRLQSIGELIKKSNKIPKEYSGYIDLIKDPLEKSLYMLALFSIYYNVTS